jgi:SAM-dependent methyltransferase
VDVRSVRARIGAARRHPVASLGRASSRIVARLAGRQSRKPHPPRPVTATPRVDAIRSTFWLVDSPRITDRWADAHELVLEGWIASIAPIDNVRFVDAAIDATVSVAVHDRPDVQAVYGPLHVVGFSAQCSVDLFDAETVAELQFTSGDATETIVIPARDVAGEESDRRSRKRTRLDTILRCPMHTHTPLERRSETSFTCSVCQASYTRTGNAYDFLPQSLRNQFSVVDTVNVSSNGYDGVSVNIINSLQDGLVLDCGAGSQRDVYHNVVNLEIVDYPSTDVLGVGERLPFADDSFDAVLSFAVLEHVKRPTECAAEIMRVLKPGGVLYCQVPFLQPVHGFPNHFFNMTVQGLVSLFEPMDTRFAGVFSFGQPVFTLSWFLAIYASSLPDDARQEFTRLTVADLMEPPQGRLAEPWVTELPRAAQESLSCCNYLMAVKRIE